MRVQTLLENAIDNSAKSISFKSIASHTGIDIALISKFFAGKRELSLCHVLKVTRMVAPAEEKTVIRSLVRDYIESSSRTNVKAALLYLANNYMYDEMTALGESIPAAHKENIAWYELIKSLALHKKGEVVGYKMLSNILSVCYDSAAVITLKQILCAHGNYTERNFIFVADLAKDAERVAAGIKNEFVRNSMYNSIGELLASVYLFRQNDPKKCRFYANTTRHSCLTSAITHLNNDYTTGISYMFEDFDEALMYLQRSADGWRQQGQPERAEAIEQDDVAFLYNYWRKPLPQSSALAASAQAHRYFVDGDVEKAQAAASKLGSSAFDLFVRGLVFADDALLLMSAMEYRLKGNEFFAQLPVQHIQSAAIVAVYNESIKLKSA